MKPEKPPEMACTRSQTAEEFKAIYPDATDAEQKAFSRLVDLADSIGCSVCWLPFTACHGMIYGDRIGLNNDGIRSPAQMCFTLAHEIAHKTLHSGNLIDQPDPEAERQADSVASLLCMLAGIKTE